MSDDRFDLSRELARVAAPCLNDVDRDFIDNEIAAGEFFFAVDDTLRAAVRENFALPAALVDQARRWLTDGVPAAHRSSFVTLLDRVTVTAAHTPRSA